MSAAVFWTAKHVPGEMPGHNVEFIEKAGLFLMNMFYIFLRNVEHFRKEWRDSLIRNVAEGQVQFTLALT